MSIITQEKIKNVADKIAKEYKPEKIILFGSYAWGVPTEDSDVDLLVIKDSKQLGREIAREINESIYPRLFPLDILAYTPSEVEKKINQDRNLFIEDVVNNGKVLYARS